MKQLLTLFLLAALCPYSRIAALDDITGYEHVDTVRLLAIGNSFSEDGVEQYLYELAHEAGIEILIGNAYRGGQSLHSHWRDVTEQNNTFEYRKIEGGIRTNTPRKALADIITDEPWDYITFQQVSQESGLAGSLEPYLTLLVGYADSLKTNPDTRFGYHMTWAYSHDSTHGGFANYGNSQYAMYDSIRNTVRWVLDRHPEFTFMIPSGTAIQNLRTSYLGDNINRDGYHLDYKFGRYTAACTWLETITGKNPVNSGYRPDGMDMTTATVCRKAAHDAVLRPDTTTNLAGEGLNAINDIIPSGLIKMNFGGEPTADPAWNDITPDCRTHTWITDTKLNPTGMIVTCTDNFSGTGNNGSEFTTTDMLMPQEVSKSYIWGYTAGRFGNHNAEPTGGYTIGHMNTSLKYDITLFASRADCKDLRETTFIVQGEETHSESIDAANNSGNTVVIRGVRPTAEGRLKITAMPGMHNTQVNKFYYLNAIMLKAHK